MSQVRLSGKRGEDMLSGRKSTLASVWLFVGVPLAFLLAACSSQPEEPEVPVLSVQVGDELTFQVTDSERYDVASFSGAVGGAGGGSGLTFEGEASGRLTEAQKARVDAVLSEQQCAEYEEEALERGCRDGNYEVSEDEDWSVSGSWRNGCEAAMFICGRGSPSEATLHMRDELVALGRELLVEGTEE